MILLMGHYMCWYLFDTMAMTWFTTRAWDSLVGIMCRHGIYQSSVVLHSWGIMWHGISIMWHGIRPHICSTCPRATGVDAHHTQLNTSPALCFTFKLGILFTV